MRFQPHEYQRYCIDYMEERPASGLFLDLGLGKTVITLTAINDLMFDRFEISRPLVVAPKRVAEDTWTRESAKWDHLEHLRVSRVLGSERERVEALNQNADVYVINRENVAWLVKYYGSKWPFDFVALDELSSFRNPSSQRFRALRRVRPMIKRVVGLTGTPRPRGLLDLWAQVYLLDAGKRLGKTFTGYRDEFFRPGARNGYVVYEWIPREGAEEEIYRRISDVCISMKAADYLQLPGRVEITRAVALTGKARQAYDRMERDTLLPLDGTVIDAESSASVTGKLMQIASGAVYDDNHVAHLVHTAKLDALEDVLEEAVGEPVLVAYNFRHEAERILERFPWAVKLDGPDQIAAWNRGEVPLLLVHPASAGHGLNLQDGGHIIVWFGPIWDLELYQQLNGRLDRQGQKERVTIIHLVAEGTHDEDAMGALERRDVGQEAMKAAVKARIGRVLHGAA